MKRPLRYLIRITCAISACVLVAFAFARIFSGVGTIAVMQPLGGNRALLITAQPLGYCEATYVEHWPSPRYGGWAGTGWRDVGPFLSWAIFRHHSAAHFGYREGTVMVPLASPGGAVAYEHSYARAEALGFPTKLAPPPFTAIVSAWQIQFPNGAAIAVAAILPAIYTVRWLFLARKKRQYWLRNTSGLCANCGYDLRESPRVCPECGRRIEATLEYNWPRWVFWIERISLILFVVVALLWVGSYAHPVARHHMRRELVGNQFDSTWREASVDHGEVWIRLLGNHAAIPQSALATQNSDLDQFRRPGGQTESGWGRTTFANPQVMGFFGALSANSMPGAWGIALGVRITFLAFLLAVLPAVRLWIGVSPSRQVRRSSEHVHVEE